MVHYNACVLCVGPFFYDLECQFPILINCDVSDVQGRLNWRYLLTSKLTR